MNKISIPFSELNFSFSRSGGAGGQNVNKVNSKVTLEWNIDQSPSCPDPVKERFKQKYASLINSEGVIQLQSQQSRSQKANIDDAIEKLHQMLNSVARPPKVRKATKPSRSAIKKRLETKKKHGDKKRMRQDKF